MTVESSVKWVFISVNTLIYPETPTGYEKTLSVTLNRYKEKTVAPDSEQITIIGSDDLKGFERIWKYSCRSDRIKQIKKTQNKKKALFINVFIDK